MKKWITPQQTTQVGLPTIQDKMVKGLPIETSLESKLGHDALATGNPIERPRLSVVEEPISGDAQVLEITDFKKEMLDCIELDEELERYFSFLSNLSREELLAIVKYEVYNRVLMQQDLDLSSEKTNE